MVCGTIDEAVGLVLSDCRWCGGCDKAVAHSPGHVYVKRDGACSSALCSTPKHGDVYIAAAAVTDAGM